MAVIDNQLFSVVMPIYREGRSLKTVVNNVSQVLGAAGVRYELLLIDDGSPDDTWSIIKEISEEIPSVRAFRLSRNFGKELALCAGLELSGGDAVIVMDADGQHPPSLLPKMIETWRGTGAEIVEATKIDRGKESVFSRTSAGLFYFLWNKLSGFEMRGACDYKLLTRRAVDAYLKMDERNVFFRGMTAWLGFERAQVPFEVAERASGRSSWSLFRRVRLAVDGISGFSSLPLQLVTLAGIVFFVFSVLFGIYTLVMQLSGHSVTGFATVILLLLFIGSLLMISLGIIGIYLARIYDEIKHRPRYVISNSIEPADIEKGRNSNV
ncbi:MAG TPA: glycosyltransferase family 2 protein [Pyrinomonadaceae bacterium]|nr:glycosyltransferase family 2 protein [Pyrinomonadaceae bacterium]